ncbi:MAG: Flp pilus assembly protein CpaB [Saccharofermentanales bacterium]
MKKIYIVALIIALMTGISVYSFAASMQKAARREYVDVVTAAVNIPERTALTKEMLVLKPIPEEAVLPSAIKDIESIIGLYTDSKLEIGETLTLTKLHAQGEKTSGLTYFIPRGKRAFTISVDAVSGVSGFILPGDRVDIIASMSLKSKSTAAIESTSFIISQNIEVLAAGTSIKVEETGVNITYTTVTLAVSPQEAVSLNLASSSGRLRLILRSPLDKNDVDTDPKTPEKIGNEFA